MESCRADLKIVQPQREQRAESYVMGLELCTTNSAAEIPQIWQRFSMEELPQIPDPIYPEVLYRVYTDYYTDDSDDRQRGYLTFVAVEVSSIDNPPENMVGISIPAGDYLVFSGFSTSTNTITQAWQQIESYFRARSPYQRAFTTDFERYDQQQVEIYVAIKSV